jgi:cysteine-rich repeat protein
MRRFSWMLLFTVGCGPSVPSDEGTDSTTSSTGVSTRASTTGVSTTTSTTHAGTTQSEPDDEDDPVCIGCDVFGCQRGTLHCLCEDGTCHDNLTCIDNRCEPPPDCGNGTLDEGEACDDGNNHDGDDCTHLCQWAPQHLAVMMAGATVRIYEFGGDGVLEDRGEFAIPTHEPAPSPLGRATTSCGGRTFTASHAAGRIQQVDTSPQPDSFGFPFEGVLELACHDSRLLATAVSGDAYTLSMLDTSGGLTLLDTLELPAGSVPRLALAPDDRALITHESAPMTASSVALGKRTLGPLDPVEPLDLTVAYGLAWALPSEQLVVVSDGRVLHDGAVQQAAPWDSRHNVWSLEPPNSYAHLAFGGDDGVVLATLDDNGLNQVGQAVAEDLPNTLVRSTHDDTLLLVVSPEGIRTFDLDEPAPDGVLPELHSITLDGTPVVSVSVM